MLALGIPHMNALSLCKDDGERVVVVGGILVLSGNSNVGRGSVVLVRAGDEMVEREGRTAVRRSISVWRHDGCDLVLTVGRQYG